MSPTTGPQTLPTTFAFSSGPKTVLDVYGPVVGDIPA